MTAEEYIKRWSYKDNFQPPRSVILVSDALEAIRLAKIEALEEMVKRMKSITNVSAGWDGFNMYCKGIDECISILTSK